MTSSFSAADSALGYLYQVRVALLWSLRRARAGADFVVSLETLDITAALTTIERARGFLEAATISEEWVRRMSQRALLLEAHHTTHIEGT